MAKKRFSAKQTILILRKAEIQLAKVLVEDWKAEYNTAILFLRLAQFIGVAIITGLA